MCLKADRKKFATAAVVVAVSGGAFATGTLEMPWFLLALLGASRILAPGPLMNVADSDSDHED